MSVLSRKREAEIADTRSRMRQLAWAAAMARAAVPVARTAGTAARDGARSTATWAAPRVNGARAWTAPRIERSGLAIRDTIAPRISEALTATARRVDVPAPVVVNVTVRRRWPKVMAGTAMLAAAAAGAAAALVLRRRNNDKARETPETGTAPQAAQDGQLRAGADGGDAEEDVSSQPQAREP